MSSLTVLLVVLAALAHATWNLLAKRAASAGPAFVFAYSAAALLVYAPWVIWLLVTGRVNWSWPVIACIVVSGAIHLAYSLFLQRGYQVADLSVVYPVARGTGPLLATVGAFVILGEPPRLLGIIGLLTIVIGILMITTDGSFAKFRRPEAQKGMRWGTATGSMIASYTVVDAYGVKVLGIHPVILDWFSLVVRLVMMGPWVLNNRALVVERMRGKWWVALAVGVLSPMGYILVLTALQLGAPLTFVAPAREMSMMAGALLGMIVLREKVGWCRLGGCLVLLMGVVMLGSGG